MNTLNIQEKNRTLAQILVDLDLNLCSNPRGTDKGDYKSYVSEFYESEFSKRRLKNNRLIEIGVRSGASLALWANYFLSIEIIGVDIVEVGSPVGPVKEYLDYPSVQFCCKDAYSQDVADTFKGDFSILIDDGPHSISSQIRFLELYLPKLAEDGVLIIEDILRSYRDCYKLMKALPKGKKYLFEMYDFDSIKQDGGFLFVVRHNKSGKRYLGRKIFLMLRTLSEWMKVFYRRVKRRDFSFQDRRSDILVNKWRSTRSVFIPSCFILLC
ncbi:MAG: class I SAM-dependent methyltransferase [Kordiimonadaceae bacterium]|nr:class I SAM-dependent methyltransferase [Kordiimonadaceae bacterium]